MNDEVPCIRVRQAAHHAQAEADGEPVLTVGGLKGAVPAAGVDADRADFDAVLTGVANDLGRGIEPHGLGVQQGGAEDVGVMAFQPG